MSSPDLAWFRAARYGLFIHYGLYSLLERGEWVLNKEEIPLGEYRRLAERFTAEALDFDWLLGKAKQDWGMRYAVLTTKHHDGFCLYDSAITDFKAPNSAARRDLVAEFVAACRRHDLRIGLYHSLNDWHTSPDAVDALERPDECYQPFIDFVHAQIRDLMGRYGKIDVMWYDGWWPFDANGWQAQKLADSVRALQPHILFNGRSGLPGDFATPEQHMGGGDGSPWEACLTLNRHWGYHRGDHDWKSPKEVCELLRQAAAGDGNLLLNVGPKGDGSIPEPSVRILDTVGGWLAHNGEAIYHTDRFVMGLQHREEGPSDWFDAGTYTASGNHLYAHIHSWPGPELVLCGLEAQVQAAGFLADGAAIPFTQEGGKLRLTLPEEMDTALPVVLKLELDRPPVVYKSGGRRNPRVPHCRYDPLPSDLAHMG